MKTKKDGKRTAAAKAATLKRKARRADKRRLCYGVA